MSEDGQMENEVTFFSRFPACLWTVWRARQGGQRSRGDQQVQTV